MQEAAVGGLDPIASSHPYTSSPPLLWLTPLSFPTRLSVVAVFQAIHSNQLEECFITHLMPTQILCALELLGASFGVSSLMTSRSIVKLATLELIVYIYIRILCLSCQVPMSGGLFQ